MSSVFTEWQCKSCTVINQGSSILCEVCERPRLAPRPSINPAVFSSPSSVTDAGEKVGSMSVAVSTPR